MKQMSDCDRSVSWTSGFKSALRMTECWLMLSTLIRIASTWCAYVTSHSTSANLLTGYLLLCALRSLPPLRLFALWYQSARCLFHKLCVHDKSHQADIDMFAKCFSIICYYSYLILSQQFFSVSELKYMQHLLRFIYQATGFVFHSKLVYLIQNLIKITSVFYI